MTDFYLFDGSLSRSEWEGFSDEELDALAVIVFDFYRERGFPFFKLSDVEKQVEFDKLYNYFVINASSLVGSDNVVRFSLYGLALAWSYFPHLWDVKVSGFRSALDLFFDDDAFLFAIRERFRAGAYFSDAAVRKFLKESPDVFSVSGVSPVSAAAIYSRYLSGSDNVVWDMCGGFGELMLGAAVSDKVGSYVCTEFSSASFNGLCDLSVDVSSWVSHIDFSVKKFGSEFFIPERDFFDLCFSSVPFFDAERYSYYFSVEDWFEKFLRRTVQNCFYGLKSDCFLVLHFSGAGSFPFLEGDVVGLAEDEGFSFVEVLELGGLDEGSNFVFVFRKL